MWNIKEFFERHISVLSCIYSSVRQKNGLLDWCTFQKMWQIAKYAISGVTGGVIQVFFLYVFVDRLGLWYIHGVIVSFLISLVIVFSLQKFWTFKDYSVERLRRQTSLYTIIAMVAFFLNVSLMYMLVDLIHLRHVLAQSIVVGFVGLLTFTLNKIFTFNNTSAQK